MCGTVLPSPRFHQLGLPQPLEAIGRGSVPCLASRLSNRTSFVCIPFWRSALAVGIKVRDKESIDRALRRFKRSVNRARILRTYRENLAFTKPSEVRREERKKARANARRRRRY
ncbi:MAG: 30S ribosomal protein S21 [Bacteroidetes bacterium]|nr:30S ribosomal protein S21 [Bacteroidota bacterium]MCH8031768.1 30S ribosomal protein S21 [Bacteroidota bacterium]